MIRYDIKTYNKDWTFKNTINPNIVMNDISFTENVNWWQWQLILNLALSFADNSFQGWDLVKVVLFNERYKQWKQIYFWYVSQITRKYDTNKWYISLTCLGIASLLNKILFSWSYAWTVTNILEQVITKFNNNYNWLISIAQIDEYEESVSMKFDSNMTCKDVIDNLSNTTNYYRFIDAEWKFYFREKLTQQNHIVSNQYAVETMSLNYSFEWIVNKFYLEREWINLQIYEDVNSQNNYWIKEKYELSSTIVNQATQDEYWNNYIKQNKDPKNASSIVVNSKYDIESISPWDTVSVVNTEYSIRNLLIEKITYTPIRITLTLEENETLRNVINN